jgi:hypothetical protein
MNRNFIVETLKFNLLIAINFEPSNLNIYLLILWQLMNLPWQQYLPFFFVYILFQVTQKPFPLLICFKRNV